MNNVESLKKLHEKLGGNPSDVESIATTAEMIEVLSELEIGGDGSSDVYITLKNISTGSSNIIRDSSIVELLKSVEDYTKIVFTNGTKYYRCFAKDQSGPSTYFYALRNVSDDVGTILFVA